MKKFVLADDFISHLIFKYIINTETILTCFPTITTNESWSHIDGLIVWMIDDVSKASHPDLNTSSRTKSRIQCMSTTFNTKWNSILPDNFQLNINFILSSDVTKNSIDTSCIVTVWSNWTCLINITLAGTYMTTTIDICLILIFDIVKASCYNFIKHTKTIVSINIKTVLW